MTLGNTTWKLHDVYFDPPSVDGTGSRRSASRPTTGAKPSCATA